MKILKIITSIILLLLKISCTDSSAFKKNDNKSEILVEMNEQDHIEHNKETEEIILENVKKYGFHIALFEKDSYLPDFVYSIGFYKNYQHPEIIIFGLKPEVMANLLHSFEEKIKKGVKFNLNEDYTGFLSNYPVRFIKVDKNYYPDYLGYCGWFYNQTFDFPAYQLVWTDKEGKYPWEESFYENWKFKQPLLDRNIDFKFYEERNLGVYTTQKTIEGNPILWVYHNNDGDWQFHSEEYPIADDAKIVTLESLVSKDPSLNDIYFLGHGQYATRKNMNSEWEIFEDNDEE